MIYFLPDTKDMSKYSIFQNYTRVKWIILAVSILISVVSIYFTGNLVDELKTRELKQIEQHANTLQMISNVESENLTYFTDILTSNKSIPLIQTDEKGEILNVLNIDFKSDISEEEKNKVLEKELAIMKNEYEPILITIRDSESDEVLFYQYIYYRNSNLLYQLKYYPYVQLAIIFVLGLIVYMIFSYSKTSEQNRIWAGLAKETAHQLGTPLSSLMAWTEYFKTGGKVNDEIIGEIDKDIKRLEIITSRFSNIGSTPVLKEENVYEVVKGTIGYLQNRISKKVKISVDTVTQDTYANLNKPLFEWVIENVCKNAVDAMSGIGSIKIHIIKASEGRVFIDINDSGKGIPKGDFKKIFQPGFSTKKRGWGLGLALVKRIIEIYHQGQIFVKSSSPEHGTTFRVILKS